MAQRTRSGDGVMLISDNYRSLQADLHARFNYGQGGDAEECAAWPDDECNALFIQLISGDMREAGMDACDMDEFDWEAYEEQAREGRIPGNIFKGDVEGHEGSGRIFYDLG